MNRHSFSGFLVIGAGRFVQILLSLASVRLMTTILNPSEVGRMNIIDGALTWSSLFFLTPVSLYIQRNLHAWDSWGKLRAYVLCYYTSYMGLVSVLFATGLLIIVWLGGLGTDVSSMWIMGLVFGSILLSILGRELVNILNLFKHRVSFVLLTNFALGLGLFCSILLARVCSAKAEYWYSGQILGWVVLLPIAIFLFLRVVHKVPDVSTSMVGAQDITINDVLKFAGPLSVYGVFYWLQTYAYRFILVRFGDSAAVGLFTTNFSIGAMPMVIFGSIFGEYYQPIFYKSIATDNTHQRVEAWNEFASAYLPSIILMGTFTAFAGPIFARILAGKDFHSAAWVAAWGAIYTSILLVNSALNMTTWASLRTKDLIKPTAVGAGIAVGSTLVLAEYSLFLGTAVSLLLGVIASSFYLALRTKKRFSITFPIERVVHSVELAIPIVAVFCLTNFLWNEFSVLQSLILLSLMAGYMLFAQFLLARSWLFGSIEKPSTERVQTL